LTTLRLIADDLTGALDTAAQFTGRMGPVPVLLDPAMRAPEGSFALSLSCRDGDEEQAVAATRAANACFSGAEIAFKKIDSLLRGHWAAEIAEIVKSGAFRRIVLAPAFPAEGRITRDGVQFRRQASGAAVPIKDLRAELSRHALQSSGSACEVLILDAASDEDLAAIVRRQEGNAETLWCGAAGLARALAGKPPCGAEPLDPPHLSIVGSHHAVTRRQVERLAAVRPDWLAYFSAESRSGGQDVRETLAAKGRCVAVPDLPKGLTAKEARARIAAALKALSAGLAAPRAMTIIGGETFAALCEALGADRLIVQGEFQPGVPISLMQSGRWLGTLCASKSGAFGKPGWLLEHLTK
jgi:D-threonate/D-erythronate kinase